MENNEFEQVHIVAYGLSALIEKAINKLQAILAFGENYPQRIELETNNDWYALSYSILLESLVLDIASLLDKAKYYSKNSIEINCNFKELKLILKKCSEKAKRYQSIILRIDKMLNKYNDLVPDVLRNKRIAHKDLKEVFSWKEYNVNLIEINRFLVEGDIILSEVFELAVGPRLELVDFDSIKKKYENSLKLPL